VFETGRATEAAKGRAVFQAMAGMAAVLSYGPPGAISVSLKPLCRSAAANMVCPSTPSLRQMPISAAMMAGVIPV